MNYIFFVTGTIIVIIVVVDILVTTLAPRASGFFTERLRGWTWRFFLWVCGNKGTNKLLNYVGMFTVVAWIIGWLGILWVGNSLLYISDEDSVVVTDTNIPASTLDKVYFVGYVLSTMGLGEFVPNGDAWKIYTSIISFSGFLIISLSITYIVPVLSAEMSKRKVSIYIHSLGTSPHDILINAWNGKDFSRLTKHFNNISIQIMDVSQNHVAYPILHNFHTHLQRESIYINLAALDEALTVLLLYLPDDTKPYKEDIYPIRYAITDFLHTLQAAFISASKNTPGPIELDGLKKLSVPLMEEDEIIKTNLEKLRIRRKLLLGMMENDGWNWKDIVMENVYGDYDIDFKPKSNEKDDFEKKQR